MFGVYVCVCVCIGVGEVEERYNLGEGSVQPVTVEVPWHGGCHRSLRDLGMRGLLGEGVLVASGTKHNARPLAATHMRMV